MHERLARRTCRALATTALVRAVSGPSERDVLPEVEEAVRLVRGRHRCTSGGVPGNRRHQCATRLLALITHGGSPSRCAAQTVGPAEVTAQAVRRGWGRLARRARGCLRLDTARGRLEHGDEGDGQASNLVGLEACCGQTGRAQRGRRLPAVRRGGQGVAGGAGPGLSPRGGTGQGLLSVRRFPLAQQSLGRPSPAPRSWPDFGQMASASDLDAAADQKSWRISRRAACRGR